MRFSLFTLLIFSKNLLAQLPETDIWLISLKDNSGDFKIESVKNITQRAGYDNQPSFSLDGKIIYYSAIKEDGQADVYAYDINKQTSLQIIKTTESEYSPQVTPDGKHISVVMVEKDSTQRFWKYDLNGKNPVCVNLQIDSVGYYAWVNDNKFAAFILTEPPSLILANTTGKKHQVLSKNIGRSIHNTENGIYFTSMMDSVRWIYLADLKGNVVPVISCVGASEDFCVYKNHYFLMADRTDLYTFDLKGINKKWQKVADLNQFDIPKVTRISIDNSGLKIAVVGNAN